MQVASSAVMWRRWRLGGWVASAMLIGGCSSNNYVYRPAEQVSATVSGLPAARYAVPPEKPMGTVLIASQGVVEMKSRDDTKMRTIAVRMVVANNADEAAWKVDTREQRVVVIGSGESAPVYVNTDGQDSPIIEVARGQKRTIDLYYPLPANAKDAKQVPEFDFLWQVHTGERFVAERTPFDRLELEPVYGYPYDYGWGYGPYWWYDPFWHGPTYVVAPVYRYRFAHPPEVEPVPLRRR
jgi:hypothetical protein